MTLVMSPLMCVCDQVVVCDISQEAHECITMKVLGGRKLASG